ncbi:hypothetical protein D3C87_588040 [compost metagenome]
MTKVLETAICVTVPGVMMLSMFESMSGSQMLAVAFIDARGEVKLRETVIHTEINESHMREFYNEQLAKRV